MSPIKCQRVITPVGSRKWNTPSKWACLLYTSVTRAKDAVYAAISHPLEVGHKFGPINHWAAERELKKKEL